MNNRLYSRIYLHLIQPLYIYNLAWPATLLKKESLAQVFSCEFCEISKNTFLTEHLWWLLLEIHFNLALMKMKNSSRVLVVVWFVGKHLLKHNLCIFVTLSVTF